MKPERALLHPLWIGALLTQLLNDHALKGGGIVPGAITGKLSDVAVLVVAPPVLAVLVRARSARAWAACHLAIGALFTALELSDGFTALFARFIALFGFPWITWSDWTDLLTLPALLVSWSVLGRAARRQRAPWRGERLVEGALCVAASVTCLATSAVSCPQAEEFDRDSDGDGYGWTRDCDDEDAAIHPGAEDPAEDGVDQDCDGYDPKWIEHACAAPVPLAVQEAGGAVVVPAAHLGTAALGSCAVAPAGASLVSVQLTQATDAWVGWLTLELDTDQPHTLSLRTECLARTSEVACAPTDGGALRVLVHTHAPLFVGVDVGAGADVAAAPTLSATFEPILCGDGVVVEPEACDDGNTVSHDGCSAVCDLEAGADT